MIRSVLGSHFSRSRPSRIAMLPRWQIVIERWATSTGAAVGPREITQSMKLRKWSSLAYRIGMNYFVYDLTH